jgi:hypothetical protein
MLGGTIQEPWIQKINLGFLLTDPTRKTPTLAERLNKLSVYMVSELYLQALR